MMTIGELAAHAGVTTRTIRYYHAKGLLPEPIRDDSGYRRYAPATLIDLIRIRTLAEAGVPLARVRELLVASEPEFAAAVADIDARLRAEIRERERHRARIARLTAGEGLVLPAEVVEFLDRLRALGVDERIVRVERDGWIPLVNRSPEMIPKWIARKRIQLDDPPLVEFYLTLGQALDQTDDRELVRLADTMAAYLERLADEHGEGDLGADLEPALAALLDGLAFEVAPSARRLAELLTERGWTGWTDVGRCRTRPVGSAP
ncbi:MerR family transcriptional regulator [Nocardia sp. NPDC004068]|uniref:MerR family transcriptional regulator n=1 Tax=Nocardia sp. NPDC004068 TaxID=3364303 RepID=UPI00367C5C5E